jgi:hypothetical protein
VIAPIHTSSSAICHGGGQFIATTRATHHGSPHIDVPEHQHPQPWLRLVPVRIESGAETNEPISVVNDAALSSSMRSCIHD